MLKIKLPLVSLALMSASPGLFAEELVVNGFMSVGAGVLSNSEASVKGYDDDISFSADTVVGVQLSKQVNDSTSATTQLVSRGGENYDTEAAWAYVAYSPDDVTTLRIGRLRTPFFYYSDFLEVGYAYNWIRPPEEVYSLDTFSSFNGIDASRQFLIGTAELFTQVYVGRLLEDFSVNGTAYEFSLQNLAGVVFGLTLGDFGYRASVHTGDGYTDLELGGTRDLDQVYGLATASGVGEKFALDGKTSHFYELAATWDNGDVSAIAEVTALEHETAMLLDEMSSLFSVAKRFDSTTVHLSYASVRSLKESDATVRNIQSMFERHDSSWILGARYDYDSSAAFKFEVQKIEEKIQAGSTSGEDGMLYSVALDLVF